MRNEIGRSFIFLIVLSTYVVLVNGQCFSLNNAACNWRHEEPSQLRWDLKSSSGGNYIELTKCNPICGNANLVSSPQSPSTADVSVTMEYKIYGTSNVFLKLYLKRDDSPKLFPLFEKYGNYGQLFPEGWTSTLVKIPKTDVQYRLMLKGYIPYADAYIAVMGINLENANAPSPAESSVKPVEQKPEPSGPDQARNNKGDNATPVYTTKPTNSAREREDDPLGYLRNGGTKSCDSLQLILVLLLAVATTIQFPTIFSKRRPVLEDEESADLIFNEYDYELEQNQLDDGRLVRDNIDFGKTVVVYPNLCKYK